MLGQKLSHLILSKRIYFLAGILFLTILSLYLGRNIELRYDMPRLLPADHPDFLAYEEYKEVFGTDGFQILVGVKDADFYQVDKFNTWKQLGEDFKQMKGIDSVFSEANFFIIAKEDSLKKFYLQNIPSQTITTQKQLDSIKNIIRDYPFYEGALYNDANNFHVMLLTVNVKNFNSKARGPFVKNIKKIAEKYNGVYASEFYYTGLPFLRATNMENIKSELRFFIVLSLLATIIVLFFFFRSFKVIMVSGIIVSIGVVWTMGIVGIFDYQISAIMGLLPPLIIVIGIPNCVYLINKYQQVYIETKDKEFALRTVIEKIGHVTLLTNATTAFGMGTFVFTNTEMLFEFGIVSSISIVLLFMLTLVMVPILFSYLPTPKEKHTKHLEKSWLSKFLNLLEHLVTNKRRFVYMVSFLVMILSVYGALKLRSEGRLIDDLPNNGKTKKDLAFYQDNLSGVMPLEIFIDVKKKGKLQQSSMMDKIDSVQNFIESVHNVTKSISYVDGAKLINQAFYNGDPEKYELPKGRDKGFIKKYLTNSSDGSIKNSTFIDTTGTKARISAKIYDIGLEELDSLLLTIKPKVDEILNPDKKAIMGMVNLLSFDEEETIQDIKIIDSLLDEFSYIENAYIAMVRESNKKEADKLYEEGLSSKLVLERGKSDLFKAIDKTLITNNITGFTVPFIKGTKYLISNLFISLIIAILGIAILMSFLFKSFWMVLITISTNLLPLIFTAGVMGYLGIALKPSTILVFSISLGIAVDDAIHYLAKFKQELKLTNGDFKKSVYLALNETGISMLYTSIILFFGFSIFMFSNYGGNQAIGLLISLTLFLAMLSNLLLLPSLLLSLHKKMED